MVACKICGKTYSRRDNMLRHMKIKHEETNVSDEETDEDSDNGSSDNGSSSDSDSEERKDPWTNIIDAAFNMCQAEYSEKVRSYMEDEGVTLDVARNRVFRNMRDKYRKTVAQFFSKTILWCRALKEDSVYNKIKKTASDLELMEDYGSEEAWRYAINKRKYLFEKVLNRYQAPDIKDAGHQRAIASTDQEGGGAAEGTMKDVVERWVQNEQLRIKNQPKIQLIGRRY